MIHKLFMKRVDDMKTSIEQINKINELLQQGESLNKLDKSGILGCSRRAYCNRLKGMGYIFNKEQNIFIHPEGSERPSKAIKVENKKTVPQTDINQILERLQALEDIVLQHNIKVSQINFKLDDRVINGNITSRGVKASREALEAFDSLCDNLPQYSKQDLLSQALVEFVDRYK